MPAHGGRCRLPLPAESSTEVIHRTLRDGVYAFDCLHCWRLGRPSYRDCPGAGQICRLCPAPAPDRGTTSTQRKSHWARRGPSAASDMDAPIHDGPNDRAVFRDQPGPGPRQGQLYFTRCGTRPIFLGEPYNVLLAFWKSQLLSLESSLG